MSGYKIKSHSDLKQEMLAVARGEIPAPKDAGMPSVQSAEVLLRLLTPENRDLMKILRDRHPKSVADLARMTNRASPNLLRTLAKLEAFGLIEMRSDGRRKVPVARVRKLHVEIDPFSQNDHFELA
jgi:predicted transcriptional regulator